jgi:protein-S-isoprenylcysteine O-methyltransferase Ste14
VLTLIRHLLAIAALPFVVAVLIPISGVVFVLFGEALMLLSGPHVQWALIFLIINFIYIPLLEERQLKERFGEAYIEYCRHVPRLLPRIRPWTPTTSSDSR